MIYLLIFILGTIIGSFLNVCIYRIPRKESIVYPPSHCPYCGILLKPFDLIPVLSYIILRGCCRECRNKISIKYPLVELLTGTFLLLAFIKFRATFDFIKISLLIFILIISAFIDLEYNIIPDKVVIPGIVSGFFLDALFEFGNFRDFFFGFVFGGGFLLLLALITKGGMGGGDIKLFAMIGSFLGLKTTVLSMFFAFISGCVAGIFLICLKIKNRKDTIPFGPFITIGSIIAVFAGEEIVSWYSGLF